MAGFIKRITLFKIPSEEGIKTCLRQYQLLRETAVRNGKSYILSNEVSRTINASEQRAQGYTVCAQTAFVNHDDVNYYDTQCKAHMKLKEMVKPYGKGVAIMLFESGVEPPKAS